MGDGDSSDGHVRRGSLLPASAAPATGERFDELLAHPRAVIEQILSSAIPGGREYVQDHDEWVVVISGGATVELRGDTATGKARKASSESVDSGSHESSGPEVVDLRGGDWLFIPEGQPHRVASTMAGTVWLAVHLHGSGEIGGGGSFST